MTKKAHITSAAILILLFLILLGVTIHLTFIFPHTIVRWADEARELTASQKVLVNISQFFRVNGLFILAAITGGITASIVWITVAAANR